MKKYISLLLALMIVVCTVMMSACNNKIEESDTAVEVASAYTEDGQLSTTALETTAAPTTAAPTQPPTEAPRKDNMMVDYIGMTVNEVAAIHGNNFSVPNSLYGGGVQTFNYRNLPLVFGYYSDVTRMGQYPTGNEVISYVYCSGNYPDTYVHPGARVGSSAAQLNINMAMVYEDMHDGGYSYIYDWDNASIVYSWKDAAATEVTSVEVYSKSM